MRAVLSKGLFLDVPAVEHRHDRQTKNGSELVVTLIVRRHRHDRARAVAHEHVVRNEHRHLLAAHRVHGIRAQENTGLFLILLSLHVRLRRDRALICGHSVLRRRFAKGPSLIDVPRILPSHQLIHELMLRREHHVGGTKQGVWAGGEDVDAEFLTCRALGTEGHFRTTGTPDPVALHCLDLVGPVEQLQVV